MGQIVVRDLHRPFALGVYILVAGGEHTVRQLSVDQRHIVAEQRAVIPQTRLIPKTYFFDCPRQMRIPERGV